MLRHAPVLIVLTLLLVGCSKEDPAPAPTGSADTTATAPTPSASPSHDPGMTGILSEEAFKKLHVLRDDKPPPQRGEELKLSSSRAYLSLPLGNKPPVAGVVVIHEWWGLNAHIKHWADRLAADGYAAIAVDLYGGEVADNADQAMALMKAVDEEKATAILLEAFRFLGEDKRINAKRRGSIGWCFGGKWSLELALAAPELDGAVVYYGHVTTDPERLAKLEASLLAVFGKQDETIPEKAVNRFEFGLEQAGGKDYKILSYDAKHAFANPSSARYDQKSAAAAWKEARAFLRSKLDPQ
jgi:carboxymethylenebutenolidase